MKFSERQIDKTDVVPRNADPELRRGLERVVDAHNQSQTELKKALQGGLSTVENTLGDLVTIRVPMPTPPFKALTLIAPWAADTAGSRYSPEYLIMPGGRVRCRGAVKDGTPAYASGGNIAILPVGARPSGLLTFAVDGGNSGLGLLEVRTDGALRCVYSGAGTVRCDLAPVEFLAESAGPPHAFVGAGWPIIVRHDLGSRCGIAEVVAFSDVNRVGGEGQGAPVLDWRDLGDGSIAIDGVWGLQWGRVYQLRLKLSPE